jgi:hypothetical protein
LKKLILNKILNHPQLIMLVCIKCLHEIKPDEIVQPTNLEYFHNNCYSLLKIKRKRFVDVSDNPVTFNADSLIEMTGSDEIIDHDLKDELGVDIAGNVVKIDKQYIKKQFAKYKNKYKNKLNN